MHVENVQNYYGSVLQSSADLRTDACCTLDRPSPDVLAALANIHPEVSARYYGCGLVVPQLLAGAQVLDLGCGAGQDAYVLAQLVGESGSVTGIDVTPEQLQVARRHVGWHQERFGFAASNVDFVDGDIERLDRLGLPAENFDVIVSNCVINLVEDKAAVFAAAHRLLKPGGELYFSDIYAERRVPEPLRRDPVLHGECLSGALYWGDFQRLARGAGFLDPRLVASRPLAITDPALADMLGGIRFHSATYRLFKLDGLEPACEDYGQAVIYRGTVPGSPAAFALDAHHIMDAGRVFPLCGNSWHMLAGTRFSPHFDFIGDFSRHFGIFPGCGTASPFAADGSASSGIGACC
jgi:SAM-dependent methyltransferase